MAEIVLPWPSKLLSPNARIHWARKAAVVKQTRRDAWLLTCHAFGRSLSLRGSNRVAVSMTFCPPDKRRRDRDNLIASMKAATDGIADALGVDDSRFVCTYAMGNVVKGGGVLVSVAEASP